MRGVRPKHPKAVVQVFCEKCNARETGVSFTRRGAILKIRNKGWIVVAGPEGPVMQRCERCVQRFFNRAVYL